MPPEWDPHTATWMGFPRVSYAESGLSREDARRAWALVANTISEYEPVRMLCHPEDLKAAEKCLAEAVDKITVNLNDAAWARVLSRSTDPTTSLRKYTAANRR